MVLSSEPTTPATALRAAADIADAAGAFAANNADEGQSRLALRDTIIGLGWLSYYILVVPAKFLYSATLWTLRLLYSPIGFALKPFLYIGRFGLALAMVPVRIVVIYEDFFIYLTVAAILGLLGGLIIRLLFSWLRRALRLDDQDSLSSSPDLKRRAQNATQKIPSSFSTKSAVNGSANDPEPNRTISEYRLSRRSRQQASLAASTAGTISPLPANDEALAAWSSSGGYLSPTGSGGSGGSGGYGKGGGGGRKGKNGLIAQTILEEGDGDDSDF